MTDYADIDKVLSELRHGHSCLLLNENSAGGMTGFVVVAAEHCESSHIAFHGAPGSRAGVSGFDAPAVRGAGTPFNGRG